MRKIAFTLLLAAVCAYASAQSTFELSFIHPFYKHYTDPKKGFGAEWNTLFPMIRLSQGPQPLGLQFGFGAGMSGLGKRTVDGIPLDSPETGNAKVKIRNMHTGMSGIVRFVLPDDPDDAVVSPYIDLFFGGRFLDSKMRITPDEHTTGYALHTDTFLCEQKGQNFGLTAGLQLALLNLSITWSHAFDNGEIVDLNSVKQQGRFLEFCQVKAPADVFLLKIGLAMRYKWFARDHESNTGRTSSYEPEVNTVPTSYTSPPPTTTTEQNGSTTTTPTKGGDKKSHISIKKCCGEEN